MIYRPDGPNSLRSRSIPPPPFCGIGIFIYKQIYTMSKIIRLTESDLIRLVKRVIKEQDSSFGDNISLNLKYYKEFSDCYKTHFGTTMDTPIQNGCKSFINDPIKKGIQNGDSCYKALTRGYSNQSALDKKIGEFINCFKSKTFL